jgi:hypothetical protein
MKNEKPCRSRDCNARRVEMIAVNSGFECIEMPIKYGVLTIPPSCRRTVLYYKGNALGNCAANEPIETL